MWFENQLLLIRRNDLIGFTERTSATLFFFFSRYVYLYSKFWVRIRIKMYEKKMKKKIISIVTEIPKITIWVGVWVSEWVKILICMRMFAVIEWNNIVWWCVYIFQWAAACVWISKQIYILYTKSQRCKWNLKLFTKISWVLRCVN